MNNNRDYELRQLIKALALPEGRERDEELVAIFSRLAKRIISVNRWAVCGTDPELIHDARALAVWGMFRFAKKKRPSRCQQTNHSSFGRDHASSSLCHSPG